MMASTVIAIVPANVHQRCPPRRSKEGTSLCDTLTGLGGQSNQENLETSRGEGIFSFFSAEHIQFLRLCLQRSVASAVVVLRLASYSTRANAAVQYDGCTRNGT